MEDATFTKLPFLVILQFTLMKKKKNPNKREKLLRYKVDWLEEVYMNLNLVVETVYTAEYVRFEPKPHFFI